MHKILLGFALVSLSSLAASPWCHIVGRIGPGKLRLVDGYVERVDGGELVDMVLHVDGKTIAGNYLRAGDGKATTVRGELADDGTLTLRDGQRSFTGKLARECKGYVGTYGQQPFELLRETQSEHVLSDQLTLIRRVAVRKGEREASLVELYGPDAPLEKINRRIRETAQSDCPAKRCESVTTFPGLIGPDFAAFNFFAVRSEKGAPVTGRARVPHWRVFSLADGKEWRLESWLRPGALDEIRKQAAPLLNDALAKRKEGVVFPEERQKAVAGFKLAPEGLGLGTKGLRVSAYYNPNRTIASAGQGDFNTELGIELPYEKIRHLVKEDTPLARVLAVK